MASFIVLEEDGTSHLETEEDTDDLILEEAVTALQVLVPQRASGGSW